MQTTETFVFSENSPVLLVQQFAANFSRNSSASFAGMLVVSPSELLHSLHLECFSLMTFNGFFSPCGFFEDQS